MAEEGQTNASADGQIGPGPDDARAPTRDVALLGRELGGDMPCVACKYNLRGLSIRAMCPECGTGVRATILAMVDPLASELRPIGSPRLVAAGLIAWTGGAAVTALVAWLPHIGELLSSLGIGTLTRPPSVGLGLILGILTSGVGSLVLIRPHAGISRMTIGSAVLGVLLYVPLLYTTWRHQMIMEHFGRSRYLTGEGPPSEALALVLLQGVVLAMLILCLRPSARLLVARSLTLRTGRVDRQTLLAIAAASGLMSFGAWMLLLTPTSPTLMAELARIAGTLVIALGGLMITIGMIGSVIDSVRIATAILTPGLSVREIIRTGLPQRSVTRSMLSKRPEAAASESPLTRRATHFSAVKDSKSEPET